MLNCVILALFLGTGAVVPAFGLNFLSADVFSSGCDAESVVGGRLYGSTVTDRTVLTTHCKPSIATITSGGTTISSGLASCLPDAVKAATDVKISILPSLAADPSVARPFIVGSATANYAAIVNNDTVCVEVPHGKALVGVTTKKFGEEVVTIGDINGDGCWDFGVVDSRSLYVPLYFKSGPTNQHGTSTHGNLFVYLPTCKDGQYGAPFAVRPHIPNTQTLPSCDVFGNCKIGRRSGARHWFTSVAGADVLARVPFDFNKDGVPDLVFTSQIYSGGGWKTDVGVLTFGQDLEGRAGLLLLQADDGSQIDSAFTELRKLKLKKVSITVCNVLVGPLGPLFVASGEGIPPFAFILGPRGEVQKKMDISLPGVDVTNVGGQVDCTQQLGRLNAPTLLVGQKGQVTTWEMRGGTLPPPVGVRKREDRIPRLEVEWAVYFDIHLGGSGPYDVGPLAFGGPVGGDLGPEDTLEDFMVLPVRDVNDITNPKLLILSTELSQVPKSVEKPPWAYPADIKYDVLNTKYVATPEFFLNPAAFHPLGDGGFATMVDLPLYSRKIPATSWWLEIDSGVYAVNARAWGEDTSRGWTKFEASIDTISGSSQIDLMAMSIPRKLTWHGVRIVSIGYIGPTPPVGHQAFRTLVAGRPKDGSAGSIRVYHATLTPSLGRDSTGGKVLGPTAPSPGVIPSPVSHAKLFGTSLCTLGPLSTLVWDDFDQRYRYPAGAVDNGEAHIAVGAPHTYDKAGAVYLLRLTSANGPSASFTKTLDIEEFDMREPGKDVLWPKRGDLFGAALACGPRVDLDGDGFPDLVVGSPGADDGYGRVYGIMIDRAVRVAQTTMKLKMKPGVLVMGPNVPSRSLSFSDREFGRSLDWVGDSNRNGHPELVIGAASMSTPDGVKYMRILTVELSSRRSGLPEGMWQKPVVTTAYDTHSCLSMNDVYAFEPFGCDLPPFWPSDQVTCYSRCMTAPIMKYGKVPYVVPAPRTLQLGSFVFDNPAAAIEMRPAYIPSALQIYDRSGGMRLVAYRRTTFMTTNGGVSAPVLWEDPCPPVAASRIMALPYVKLGGLLTLQVEWYGEGTAKLQIDFVSDLFGARNTISLTPQLRGTRYFSEVSVPSYDQHVLLVCVMPDQGTFCAVHTLCFVGDFPTRTVSPSPTPSPTHSPTLSLSRSPTTSPSVTQSPTPPPTVTPIPTTTLTYSLSATQTASVTYLRTGTHSPTPTGTVADTVTPRYIPPPRAPPDPSSPLQRSIRAAASTGQHANVVGVAAMMAGAPSMAVTGAMISALTDCVLSGDKEHFVEDAQNSLEGGEGSVEVVGVKSSATRFVGDVVDAVGGDRVEVPFNNGTSSTITISRPGVGGPEGEFPSGASSSTPLSAVAVVGSEEGTLVPTPSPSSSLSSTPVRCFGNSRTLTTGTRFALHANAVGLISKQMAALFVGVSCVPDCAWSLCDLWAIFACALVMASLMRAFFLPQALRQLQHSSARLQKAILLAHAEILFPRAELQIFLVIAPLGMGNIVLLASTCVLELTANEPGEVPRSLLWSLLVGSCLFLLFVNVFAGVLIFSYFRAGYLCRVWEMGQTTLSIDDDGLASAGVGGGGGGGGGNASGSNLARNKDAPAPVGEDEKSAPLDEEDVGASRRLYTPAFGYSPAAFVTDAQLSRRFPAYITAHFDDRPAAAEESAPVAETDAAAKTPQPSCAPPAPPTASAPIAYPPPLKLEPIVVGRLSRPTAADPGAVQMAAPRAGGMDCGAVGAVDAEDGVSAILARDQAHDPLRCMYTLDNHHGASGNRRGQALGYLIDRDCMARAVVGPVMHMAAPEGLPQSLANLFRIDSPSHTAVDEAVSVVPEKEVAAFAHARAVVVGEATGSSADARLFVVPQKEVGLHDSSAFYDVQPHGFCGERFSGSDMGVCRTFAPPTQLHARESRDGWRQRGTRAWWGRWVGVHALAFATAVLNPVNILTMALSVGFHRGYWDLDALPALLLPYRPWLMHMQPSSWMFRGLQLLSLSMINQALGCLLLSCRMQWWVVAIPCGAFIGLVVVRGDFIRIGEWASVLFMGGANAALAAAVLCVLYFEATLTNLPTLLFLVTVLLDLGLALKMWVSVARFVLLVLLRGSMWFYAFRVRRLRRKMLRLTSGSASSDAMRFRSKAKEAGRPTTATRVAVPLRAGSAPISSRGAPFRPLEEDDLVRRMVGGMDARSPSCRRGLRSRLGSGVSSVLVEPLSGEQTEFVGGSASDTAGMKRTMFGDKLDLLECFADYDVGESIVGSGDVGRPSGLSRLAAVSVPTPETFTPYRGVPSIRLNASQSRPSSLVERARVDDATMSGDVIARLLRGQGGSRGKGVKGGRSAVHRH